MNLKIFRRFLVVLLCCVCASCGIAHKDKEDRIPDIKLMRLDVPALRAPPLFFEAFKKSCAAIVNKDPELSYGPNELGGKVRDWVKPCEAASKQTPRLLQDYFHTYQVYEEGDKTGLFTGYYEPLLNGSYEQTEEYFYPLYMRPESLVEVNLGEFRETLKGERIAGKVVEGRLKPFSDRSEIDKGALEDQDLEMVWVDDKADAFFLHIQGSGVIEFPDGTRRRIGYAAQNGHVYYAIGKTLIERGEVAREDMSLQAIKTWITENPDRADELMEMNPSYIFFRWIEGDGPLGAQGVALTPGHSLAVDRRLIPYGTPVFLTVDHPDPNKQNMMRMMVAQDTGGAIRGAVRGDVFWGAGEKAAEMAGKMKSKGSYILFLPKTIVIPEQYVYNPSLWMRFKQWAFNE